MERKEIIILGKIKIVFRLFKKSYYLDKGSNFVYLLCVLFFDFIIYIFLIFKGIVVYIYWDLWFRSLWEKERKEEEKVFGISFFKIIKGGDIFVL